MIKKETAIIISNYNGYEDTVRCVKSLLESSYKDFFIVIVDDCSNDKDRIQGIKDDFDGIIVITSNVNKGFAGANNIGIKKAIQYSPKYIVLLNNDTIVREDSLGRLVANANDNTVTGPKILSMDNPKLIWSAGGEIDRKLLIPKNIGTMEPDGDVYSKMRTCEFLSFCNVCIPAKAFDIVGYLDEKYYMYSEDVDYCFRLIKAGIKCVYIPDAVILHKGGVSNADNSRSSTYYGIRNECYIRDKYIENGKKFNKKLFRKVKRERFFRKILNKPNGDNEIYYNAMNAYFYGEVGKSDKY